MLVAVRLEELLQKDFQRPWAVLAMPSLQHFVRAMVHCLEVVDPWPNSKSEVLKLLLVQARVEYPRQSACRS
jgi:hypothetical protein